MTIQQLVAKYNDPLTGLFKDNAPLKAINAPRLREYVGDWASMLGELSGSLPYAKRAEWITGTEFPITIIGGGSSAIVDSQPGYFGLLQLLTNVAAGGVHVTTAKILMEQSMLLRGRMYAPVLSTGPQSYYYRYGLLADPTVRNQVDGVYFEYSHDINGGSWVVNVYKAGVLTQTLTTVPFVANTAYTLQILFLSNIGVRFTINDVEVAFVPFVNLPVVAMQYANGLRKYNGATNVNLFIDSDLIVNGVAV